METVKIKSNIKLTEGLYLLSFRRNFDFVPGQIIEISIDKSIVPRMYSICSGNNAENIEILYGVKERGQLTPCLSKLSMGDEIYISEPKGNFKSCNNGAVWIASGTGIAPFASFLLSNEFTDIYLIHGARSMEAFYLSSFFKEKLKENYIQCSSQGLFEGAFNGRVTHFIDQMQNLLLNKQYFICGSAEMVVDTREILLKKGVSFNKITAEIYF